MQPYTVYLYQETALHVSGGISTHHQERIQLYLQYLVLSHRYCYLPLSVGTDLSVLWVAYATHSTLKPVPTLPLVVICTVRLLFVLFYILFLCKCVLPPGDNPIVVNKYIIILSIITVQPRGLTEKLSMYS
jgi:hypothetical protein